MSAEAADRLIAKLRDQGFEARARLLQEIAAEINSLTD
jgi:hypothetical protein